MRRRADALGRNSPAVSRFAVTVETAGPVTPHGTPAEVCVYVYLRNGIVLMNRQTERNETRAALTHAVDEAFRVAGVAVRQRGD